MVVLLTASMSLTPLLGAVVTSWSTAPDENGKVIIPGAKLSLVGSKAFIKSVPTNLSFQINVKEKLKKQSHWCFAGINIVLSNKDWLQIALQDLKGKQNVEVTMMKDGKGSKEGLGTTEIVTDGSWKYDTTYTVNVEFTATLINIKVVDPEDKVIIEQNIPVTELPKPLNGGKLTMRAAYATVEFGTVNLE